jgi:Acyl-protein synthetase, LuxE
MIADVYAKSDALHARVQNLARNWGSEAGAVEGLGADLLQFQYAHNPRYRRLCQARGLAAADLTLATAPAVPTDAFRFAHIGCFSEAEMPVVFQTSGTTQGLRGKHALRHTQTYAAAALAFGRRALLRSAEAAPELLVLGPGRLELPDSSLTFMLDLFVRELAITEGKREDSGAPAARFFLSDGDLQLSLLASAIARAHARAAPVLLMGTSFAMVNLLDAPVAPASSWALPQGSLVVHTGGFKGKSRELAPEALRRALAQTFSVAEADVICEYGMTELSSQFYQLRGQAPLGTYAEPPWAWVIPVHEETLEPVIDGEVGLARIVDLANVDSVCIVQTQDRVRRVRGGFELLGRAPGALPRGCALSIEELLSSNTSEHA